MFTFNLRIKNSFLSATMNLDAINGEAVPIMFAGLINCMNPVSTCNQKHSMWL